MSCRICFITTAATETTLLLFFKGKCNDKLLKSFISEMEHLTTTDEKSGNIKLTTALMDSSRH